VAAIVPASELNEVKPADATIDQLELDRLLAELDRVIGSIPRSERQAAIRQALNGARQMRGDHESVSGSPTEFFGRMMEREDVRNLLTRLADQ
jgi:hypothetical protein